MTEAEVGDRHHGINENSFEQTPGYSEGQRNLAS